MVFDLSSFVHSQNVSQSHIKNVNSPQGLAELNKFLSTRSYVEGYAPSAADEAIFSQLPAAVSADKYPHIFRWQQHIQSFSFAQRACWPGEAKKAAKAADWDGDDDDDDSISLSDDDDDDDAAAAAIAARKQKEKAEGDKDKKKAGKSSLILDIKPEAAETDLDALEKTIRSIVPEGLTWGECQHIPVAFGVHKLRIACSIFDYVSVDDLQEEIEELDDVQSTDIFAFNKQ